MRPRRGSRIEVGVSYVLDASAFPDTSASNYPFDPADVLVAAFFVLEENPSGQEIYEGIGVLRAVPEPSLACLVAVGALLAAGTRRR